jgi:hypothetical protein
MLDNNLEYTQWNVNSTLDDGDKYEYEYISQNNPLYGIHQVKVQYADNPVVITNAKFDTGARTTSISIELGKKLGLTEEIFKVADELESHKIDKSITEPELKKMVDELAQKYNFHLEKSRSASGVTIRVYFPITIMYNGRILKTQANLKDRTGLKSEMLLGLSDML